MPDSARDPSNPKPLHGASALVLPDGSWSSVFECLCAHFPGISVEQWRERFASGRVVDDDGMPLAIDHAHRRGLRVRYFRAVADEPRVAPDEVLVHVDDDLVVVDKPHFLPVVPAGRFVEESLLRRLMRRLETPDLVPLHRLDRDTAGLVMFSPNPATRGRYQSLFRERAIEKRYEALATPLPYLDFPFVQRSRIVPGEPFFRMREVDGPPNSETRIDVIARSDTTWHYALEPVTGRKHQLRVHMAALGAPILHDRWYPQLRDEQADDPARPLGLLARSLAFRDPLDGRPRRFDSTRTL
jgi:tRNA pseudouridine32 synthase/23S rRNA pseudouridine746 synthase